MHNYKMTQKH